MAPFLGEFDSSFGPRILLGKVFAAVHMSGDGPGVQKKTRPQQGDRVLKRAMRVKDTQAELYARRALNNTTEGRNGREA
jgi:hypothetical protein